MACAFANIRVAHSTEKTCSATSRRVTLGSVLSAVLYGRFWNVHVWPVFRCSPRACYVQKEF